MSSRWHEHYEHGRPSYPADAVRVADLAPSSVVLEVAAGTGKLTRVLLEEFTRVVAVEPDPAMRTWCQAVCPRARLVAGAAETLPIARGSVDVVFVAEAFHWFDHRLAVEEFARVLRPAGALVLMWNRPVGRPDPPITAVEELLQPLWPDDIEMPLDLDPRRFSYAREWPKAFDGPVFEPLEQSSFANARIVSREELVSYFGSMGWVDALGAEKAESVLREVRSRLSHPRYRLPFETDVHWTRLAEAQG